MLGCASHRLKALAESWQNGYCTGLENRRPKGHGGSNPSLSVTISHPNYLFSYTNLRLLMSLVSINIDDTAGELSYFIERRRSDKDQPGRVAQTVQPEFTATLIENINR